MVEREYLRPVLQQEAEKDKVLEYLGKNIDPCHPYESATRFSELLPFKNLQRDDKTNNQPRQEYGHVTPVRPQ
jgi:hypothetical protein